MSKKKRKVKVAVISDVHLGTYGCQARELLRYLKSIQPDTLILNGDIVDIWQFSKRYWPKSHMQVVKQITAMLTKGTKVVYVTGNHDEMMRKFTGLRIGNFEVVNKIVLELDGRKAWIFHGDVFDVTMQHSKWLAQLGGKGYDLLILLNSLMNYISSKLGKGKISLSKKIKNSVKSAVKYINNFEQTAAEIAIQNKFDYVLCGHIHFPVIREVANQHGSTVYLNSGDWVENLTALEYDNGKWRIYKYEDHLYESDDTSEESMSQLDDHQLFKNMLHDFKMMMP